jgi:dienelactone hydrolase
VRRRLLWVARLLIVFTLALVLGLPLASGYLMGSMLPSDQCGGGGNPADYGMRAEAVTFPATELKAPIHAYFIPGTNGVTLIVPPTGACDRGCILDQIAILNRHGYAALTFQSRPCMGYRLSLGYTEVREVADALAYLKTRSDVDMGRVGVHGFSTAGATAIMAAARYPQLRAVVAEGNYHDFGVELSDNLAARGWMGPLVEFGARVGYRAATGLDMAVLSPIGVIGQIAPRPILLIYGTNEPALYGGRRLLAAAGPNAQLWEVPGADHGQYVQFAAAEFERRVIAFFDAAFEIRR